MVNGISFGSNWQNQSLAPLTMDMAAAPHINYKDATAGKSIPAAEMTIEEALYGKRKKHPVRDFLGNLALFVLVVSGVYLGAKKIKNNIKVEEGQKLKGHLKTASEHITKWGDDAITWAKNAWSKITAKSVDSAKDAAAPPKAT